MRSIWKGAIAFGLVNVPVKLFSATQESSLDLDMLDKKDHANIKFKRVNAETGKEVEYKDIVKGYNLDGRYVILDETDFKAANPEKTQTIMIDNFVDEDKIDTIYYENPYYLEPEKSGSHAYALLCEALKKTKKVGVATVVLRNKEHLAVLKPYGKVLVLNMIRFAEEIRATESLEIPSTTKVKPQEMQMAIALMDHMSHPFDIKEFKDNYASELMKLIKAKAKGKAPRIIPAKKVETRTHDLMEQLKSSLKASRKKAA
jgi:DNA end-binding protein Ku